MTELRQAREVDMVPEELRYVPQVKSDIIIQRRNVTLAPIEASDEYTRTGTNTITFNIQDLIQNRCTLRGIRNLIMLIQ